MAGGNSGSLTPAPGPELSMMTLIMPLTFQLTFVAFRLGCNKEGQKAGILIFGAKDLDKNVV